MHPGSVLIAVGVAALLRGGLNYTRDITVIKIPRLFAVVQGAAARAP